MRQFSGGGNPFPIKFEGHWTNKQTNLQSTWMFFHSFPTFSDTPKQISQLLAEGIPQIHPPKSIHQATDVKPNLHLDALIFFFIHQLNNLHRIDGGPGFTSIFWFHEALRKCFMDTSSCTYPTYPF